MSITARAWGPRASQDVEDHSFGLAELVSALVMLLIYSHLLARYTKLYVVRESLAYFAVMIVAPAFLLVNAKRTEGFKEQRPVILAILAYLVMAFIGVVVSGGGDISLYRDRLAYVFTTVAVIVVFASVRKSRPIIIVCQLVLAASVVINLIEFFDPTALPVRLSTVEGRAAGLYSDSNESAAFIACLAPIACLGARPLTRVIIYAVALAGVYVTFSRSGLLIWVVAVMMSELLPAGAKSIRSSQLGALAAFGLLGGILVLEHDAIVSFLSSLLHNQLDQNTEDRIRFATNDSSRERLYMAMIGLQQFARSPIFGQGVGSGFDLSFGVSVHNIFIQTLMESGLIGFIWLAYYLFAMGSRSFPYGIWNVMLFGAVGMFSHTLFDGPHYGIIVALFCTIPVIFEKEASERRAAAVIRPPAGGWRPAGTALPRASRRPWAVPRSRLDA